MAGLGDLLDLRQTADEIEGLAQVDPSRRVQVGGYSFTPEQLQQKNVQQEQQERGILKEGVDSFLHSLGPQNVRLFGAGIRSLGTVSQSEAIHDFGNRIERAGEGMDFGAPPSTSMTEIDDAESLARWMAGGLGQGLGSIGAPIAAGATGALAGAAVGGPLGATIGGIGTAFGVNDMILAGEAVTQFEESGVDPYLAAEAAQAIAPAMAALDTLGVLKVLRGPARGDKALLRYLGQRIAHGASIESATEMAQGVIRELTDAELSGEPKLAERALSILEEGAIAAMTGGVVGGVAAPFARKGEAPVEDSATADPDVWKLPPVVVKEEKPDKTGPRTKPVPEEDDLPPPQRDETLPPVEPEPKKPKKKKKKAKKPEVYKPPPAVVTAEKPENIDAETEKTEPEGKDEAQPGPEEVPQPEDTAATDQPDETAPDGETPAAGEKPPVEPESEPAPPDAETAPEPALDDTSGYPEIEGKRKAIALTNERIGNAETDEQRRSLGEILARENRELESLEKASTQNNLKFLELWKKGLEEGGEKVDRVFSPTLIKVIDRRIRELSETGEQPARDQKRDLDDAVKGYREAFSGATREASRPDTVFGKDLGRNEEVPKGGWFASRKWWDEKIQNLNTAHDAVVKAGGSIDRDTLTGRGPLHDDYSDKTPAIKQRLDFNREFLRKAAIINTDLQKHARHMLDQLGERAPGVRWSKSRNIGRGGGYHIYKSHITVTQAERLSSPDSVLAHEIGHFVFTEMMSHADRISFLEQARESYSGNREAVDNEFFEGSNAGQNIQELFAWNFQKWWLANNPDAATESYWKKIVKRYVKPFLEWMTGKRNTAFDTLFEKYLNPKTPGTENVGKPPKSGKKKKIPKIRDQVDKDIRDEKPKEEYTDPPDESPQPAPRGKRDSDQEKARRERISKIRKGLGSDEASTQPDDSGVLFMSVTPGGPPQIDAELRNLAIDHAIDVIQNDHADFVNYARTMLSDLGEPVRPWLRMFYEAARYYPGVDTTGMSTPQEIDEIYERNRKPKEEKTDARDRDEGDASRDNERGSSGTGRPDRNEGGTGRTRVISDKPGTTGEGTAETAGETGDAQDQPGGDEGTGDGETPGLPGETGTEDRPDTGEQGTDEGIRQDGNVVYDKDGKDPLGEYRSVKEKAVDNIMAIRLVKALKDENRPATAEEQHVLSRYVGWGGLSGAFPNTAGKYAKGMETLGNELRELLTEKEYETARRSIQYAHYTSADVIRAMWKIAYRLHVGANSSIFEPGMGIGHFAGLMPNQIVPGSTYRGIEMDGISADIAARLFPEYTIENSDYTRMSPGKNRYDFIIGNPPFGDIKYRYEGKTYLIHDYFFIKSLDALKPGGTLMFVTSAGTMNKAGTAARLEMAKRAKLVGAFRLPGGTRGAFAKSSNTQVTTDVIVLRKYLEGESKQLTPEWIETENREYRGEFDDKKKEWKMISLSQNRYFNNHPERIIGEEGPFDPLYPNRYGVRYIDYGTNSGKEFVRSEDGLKGDLEKQIGYFTHGGHKPQTGKRQQQEPETEWQTDEKKLGSFS